MNDFAPGMCLELETVTVSKWFCGWMKVTSLDPSSFEMNHLFLKKYP